MTEDAELIRLREEWRDRLLSDIESLKKATEEIKKELANLRLEYAQNQHVQALDTRIRQLEDSKSKIMGGFFALAGLQTAVAFISWILAHK